jgi:hypothetical protein
MTNNSPEPLSNRERAAKLAIVQQIIKNLATAAEALRRKEARQYFSRPRQTEVPEWDGVPLGTVQLVNGASGWKVTDRRAFEAWVEANNPTALVKTTSVNPLWEKGLLDSLKKGDWVDAATGEVLPPPDGVAPYAADPTLKMMPTPEGTAVVLEQLGELAATLGFQPPKEIGR